MDDAATAAFRHAAPFVVLSVAPGLAARYVSRARLLSPTCSFPDSCRKCGTYLFDGSGQIRAVRLRKGGNKSQPQRALRRVCLVCGNTSTVKLHRGTGPSTSQPHQPPQSSHPDSERAVTLSSPAPSSSHPRNVQSTLPERQHQRQGGTQRTGLKELLAQNRKEKEQRQNTNQTTIGLAAFLKDL